MVESAMNKTFTPSSIMFMGNPKSWGRKNEKVGRYCQGFHISCHSHCNYELNYLWLPAPGLNETRIFSSLTHGYPSMRNYWLWRIFVEEEEWLFSNVYTLLCEPARFLWTGWYLWSFRSNWLNSVDHKLIKSH